MKRVVSLVCSALALVFLATGAAAYGAQKTAAGVVARDDVSAIPWRAITVVMRPGSLRANLERLGRENGWKQVVWGLKNDYQWTGVVKVTAPDLQAALQKLLDPYPLQAVFYEGNRVLLIQPRTLR